MFLSLRNAYMAHPEFRNGYAAYYFSCQSPVISLRPQVAYVQYKKSPCRRAEFSGQGPGADLILNLAQTTGVICYSLLLLNGTDR